MSSLQRLLQASKEKSREYETSNGKFESCFANGLDLSEFSSSNFTGGRPKSAAAELLRVKKIEKERQRQDEIEERRMEGVIRQRAQHVKKSIVQKRNGAEDVVVDALVKMHDSDPTSTSHKRKKKISRSTSVKRVHGSKRQAYKKSRKLKF
jgi:hypothetical protein